MKTEPNITTGISVPEKVDEFMQTLNYPLKELLQYLREFILSIDKNLSLYHIQHRQSFRDHLCIIF